MDFEGRTSSPDRGGRIPIKKRVNELDRRAKDATKMLDDNKKRSLIAQIRMRNA